MSGLLFALLGLVFGSFATAVSHRLPRGLDIGMDRSRCPVCDHVLGAAELVPVLSWALARGRCRHCGAAVSWRYPLTELASMALFLLAWMQGNGDLVLSALLALTGLGLLIVTVVDLEEGIIPDAVLLTLLPVALATVWRQGGDWFDAGAGAVAGIALTWGLRAGYKAWRGIDGLGLGDVKFLGLAGLYLGLSGLGLFLLETGLIGIPLGLAWRTAGRGPAFPLGPALCAALLLGLFFPQAGDWLPLSWR
jgi:leader peptidase (prepilin peptidase)/N-methyltransferase